MKYHRKLKSVSSVSTNKRAVTEACLKNIKWHRQVCSRAGSYKQTDVVLFVSCFLALSVNMWADVGCVPEERWTGISQSGSCCSGDWESERRCELAHRDRTPPSFTWNKRAARAEDEARVEMLSARLLADSLSSQRTARLACCRFLISGARWRPTGAGKMASCEVTVCLNLFAVWHWVKVLDFHHWQAVTKESGWFMCAWCLRLRR